jgi:hypothetical protein
MAFNYFDMSRVFADLALFESTRIRPFHKTRSDLRQQHTVLSDLEYRKKAFSSCFSVKSMAKIVVFYFYKKHQGNT